MSTVCESSWWLLSTHLRSSKIVSESKVGWGCGRMAGANEIYLLFRVSVLKKNINHFLNLFLPHHFV